MAIQEFESKAKGFFSEFWAFAAKGNAMQLAVAVVVGGAFSAIVNSLVNNIITPFISLTTPTTNFNEWGYTLRPAETVNGTTTPAVVIGYGPLLQAIINFLIIALCIFLIFKLFQGIAARFQRKEAEKPTPPPVSTEEKLLSEIRDLLKESVEKKAANTSTLEQ